MGLVVKDENGDIDHYKVLGLPAANEGAKLCERQIGSAYRKMALVLHPDKRPNHPKDLAAADFRRLKLSYDVLSDQKSRQLYDFKLKNHWSEREAKEKRRREEEEEEAAIEKRRREEEEKRRRYNDAKIDAELASILRQSTCRRRSHSKVSNLFQDRVVRHYFNTLANQNRHTY